MKLMIVILLMGLSALSYAEEKKNDYRRYVHHYIHHRYHVYGDEQSPDYHIVCRYHGDQKELKLDDLFDQPMITDDRRYHVYRRHCRHIYHAGDEQKTSSDKDQQEKDFSSSFMN